MYGMSRPEDQNLEYYVGKKVARRLEREENFYSYEDILENSSRELSKEREDSQNSRSVRLMLTLRKKYADGKPPRKIEKNKVVCPVVVHKKIETSSEHYSGFIKANEYLEQQQKLKEDEEKMKVSEQLIQNLKITDDEDPEP